MGAENVIQHRPIGADIYVKFENFQEAEMLSSTIQRARLSGRKMGKNELLPFFIDLQITGKLQGL